MATPVLYATSGSYMYRIDFGVGLTNDGLPASIDSFQLDHSIVSLTAGNNGELWGTERHDSSQDGNYALYRFDNINSTPVMAQQGDFLDGPTSSILNVEGELHGFMDSTKEMITIDPDTGSYTVIGSYADLPVSPASSGYDSLTQSAYGIRGTELFRFDLSLESSFNATKVADVDFGEIDQGPMGGEVIDGVYYHANVSGLTMSIFAIDLTTGLTEEVISFEVHEAGATGLAGFSVPTPGSAALLALGGLVSTRRRR